MQFRVVIPENVKSGQTIRIHCPDGTEANVKVPKGLKPGDSFIFEMSADQLNNPKELLESLNRDKQAKNAKDKAAGGTAGNQTERPKGFLDREISNVQDFMLALGVGVIIGLGIVIGFLGGVLYVTEDTELPQLSPTAAPGAIETPPGFQSASASFGSAKAG